MADERLRITLLDVGAEKYGDCILCQFGDVSVLIDGAHPGDDDGSEGHYSIPDQIGYLLNKAEPPYDITLLVVTHPHNDHIGCLPTLVENEVIRVKWALVADPRFRWGQGGFSANSHPMASDERARMLINALQEENRADDSREQLEAFFSESGNLETRYRGMLTNLDNQGTTVIRQGVSDPSDLIADLDNQGVRLRIIGPSRDHLDECRRLLKQNDDASFNMMSNVFGFSAKPADLVDTYRKLANGPGAFFANSVNKGAINLQSIITLFEYEGQKVLSAGDFQFAMPEVNSEMLRDSVRDIREEISSEAPYYFYKLSHHASYNGFNEDIYQEIRGTPHLGVNGGTDDRSHPDEDILHVLRSHKDEVKWVRTDHNGQSSISRKNGQDRIYVSRGMVNDWTPNTGGMGFSVGQQQPPAAASITQVRTDEFVEVTAKIPHQATRVRLTIDVEPPSSAGQASSGAGREADASSKAEGGGMGMSKPAPAEPGATEPGGSAKKVLVEMRVSKDARASFAAGLGLSANRTLESLGFQPDPGFKPVPVPAPGAVMSADEESIVIRGEIDESRIAELENQPNVLKVWSDSKIAPFSRVAESEIRDLKLTAGFGICPLPPCDCEPGVAKGTIRDVADQLGVKDIWSAGFRGEDIVVGVVDGGITAKDRVTGGTIPNVIGGSKENWGQRDGWDGHANMCATDVLGIAPKAKVYDLRLSDGDLLSEALEAFDWAIEQHKKDGTPQILSNSWGIYKEEWAPDYARDPNHVFSRKVVEALDEGIIVLFAAGNCGGTCASERCGKDTGPGKSIWGANGHPRVMTVGAANLEGQFIGYSSQGPAALDANKPDFCSISHFEGYTDSDNGTSAACPIASGIVALFKQADSSLTQSGIKKALRDTARSIGASGWNKHAGAGIIQPKHAFERLVRPDAGREPIEDGQEQAEKKPARKRG